MNRMMTKARHRQTNMLKTRHDEGGRVTQTVNGRGQVLGLTWNLRGELVSVSTNGAFAEGYAYDPMGRRIATTDNSGTVYHAYDGIHCVADLAPDGTLLRSYTWGTGIDNLLAVTFYGDSTNTLYAVTDPLGTVHALVGTNGVPAVTYAYDSWGNLLSADGDETPAAALRFTWQGREYSFATALYNFRARWYDPASGRWLSKDPIGLEGGLNLYEAFGNNPVCFSDSSGMDIHLLNDTEHSVLYIDNPKSSKGITIFDFAPKEGGKHQWTPNVIFGPSETRIKDHVLPKCEPLIRIHTTPMQDEIAVCMVNTLEKANLPYSFFANNCTHMARLVLTTAGIPLGNKLFDWPSRLVNDVKRYVKSREAEGK